MKNNDPILVLEPENKNIQYYWNGKKWTVGELVNEIISARKQVESLLK